MAFDMIVISGTTLKSEENARISAYHFLSEFFHSMIAGEIDGYESIKVHDSATVIHDEWRCVLS